MRYLAADLGGRNNSYDTLVTRAFGGLKGTAYNRDWELGELYTQRKTDVTQNGEIRDSVLRDYLNGTNLSGMNPGSAYYRLGVNAGLNSAATIAAISPTLQNTATTSIASVDFKANRELMQLRRPGRRSCATRPTSCPASPIRARCRRSRRATSTARGPGPTASISTCASASTSARSAS